MSLVWLDRRAREVIENESARRLVRETGGALFGYESDEGVAVVCAFGPGRHARHGYRSFEPDPGTTRRLMESVRDASDGRYRFVGSWHTHPGGTSAPSSADEQTAFELSDQPDLLLPRPLLLIQATRIDPRAARLREMRAWRYSERRRLSCADVVQVEIKDRHCP